MVKNKERGHIFISASEIVSGKRKEQCVAVIEGSKGGWIVRC
jgi:hypothetical protein